MFRPTRSNRMTEDSNLPSSECAIIVVNIIRSDY